jgi:hypothetical protein
VVRSWSALWKGETPPGIKKVFRSSTQFALAAYRTQLFNPEDMPGVMKVQAGYKVQSLSAYLKLATRLMVTDAGLTFWDAAFGKPPEQVPMDPADKQFLERALIFIDQT